MFRKSISCILMILMLCSMSVTCFAGEASTEKYDESEMVPAYVVINEIKVVLSFSGNCAKADTQIIISKDDADKIIYRIVLERKSGGTYIPVKTWRDQTISVNPIGTTQISKTHNVSEKGNYHIKVSGTAYKGTSVVETFSETVSADVGYK